ncbi:MAG: nucleotide exchange factor GrpE [Cytophagaceae bacterium]
MVQEDNKEKKTEKDPEEGQTEQKTAENEIFEKEQPQNSDQADILKNEVGELKDKYIRLYSEFENFRRRTSKEKIDMIKAANEDVIVSLLSVVDDFERAQKAFSNSAENDPAREGINLIYNKLYRTLESKGLKPMDALGKEFNSDLHEAITQSPAPSEDLKGKIIDVLEKGYYLNDKVIRHAKVVIGS